MVEDAQCHFYVSADIVWYEEPRAGCLQFLGSLQVSISVHTSFIVTS